LTRPEDANLPIWLRGVPLPPAPADLQPDAAASSLLPSIPTATDSSGLPSWLRDLGGDEPAETSAAPIAGTEPVAEAEDLPDWLRNLGEAQPAAPPVAREPEPPVAPAAPRTPGFTSWLTGDAPASPPATSSSKEELPAWLRESAASNEPETPEELPNWLQDLEPKPVVPPAEQTMVSPPSWAQTPVDEPVPDWLRTPEPPAANPSPEPPTAEPVPDWLRTPAAADPAEIVESTEVADDDIPAWLRSMPTSGLDAATSDTDKPADELDLGLSPFSLGEPPETGSASAWLGASASQLIKGSTDDQGGPAWLRAESQDDDSSDVPGWLRDPAAAEPVSETPVPPAASPQSTGATDADVPGWLRDMSSAPATEPQQPGWMSGAESESSPSSGTSDWPGNTPATPAEDIPAWLRAEEPATPAVPAAPAEDVPAWLRDPVPAQPALPAEQDVPNWLRAEPQQAEAIPADPSRNQADLPAWMLDSEPAAPAVPASGELPEWLQQQTIVSGLATGDALPPWLRDDEGEPLPTGMAPGDAGLPAWLRGSDESLAIPADNSPSQPEITSRSTQSTSSTSTSDSDLLGGADLPAWLRRDTEKPRDTNPADARSLDWLSRLGSIEDEVAPSEVVAAPRLTLPVRATRSPAQLEALALLRTMAASPLPGATPMPAAAPPNALKRIGFDRVVSFVLLMALILALITPGLDNLLGTPQATPQAQALFEQISALGSDDVVLLGYEWDAQRLSELQPLEHAVIGQLIAQKTKVILLSTDPQGALLQFDLRDQLDAGGYQVGAVDYLLLGYRAGGEIALRQFAQDVPTALRSDFRGQDPNIGTKTVVSQGNLNTLDDFAMILVVADEPSDVQGWMEQIKPFTTTPIGFLVPAAVEPFSQPYFRQQGVFYLAGTQDALAYEQQRGGDSATQTAIRAGQLRLTTLVFAGLLAVGMVGMLIYMALLRRRGAA
jgi:hypothetical protein